MKRKTMTTYRTALGFLLLPALLLTGQHSYLSNTPRVKLPEGSVAPLY